MSLAAGLQWSYKDIKLTGYSIAGMSTSVAFPAADVCFDVAQGLPFQVPVNTILLTHGHMDHAGGIPYLLGQKAMRGTAVPDIYMPPELVNPMQEIMKLWSKIENHSYPFRFHGVEPGAKGPLKGKFFFKPFRTYHRIASQGYTVYQNKKRLRPEYHAMQAQELGALRRKGTPIEESFDEPVISFTGDTRIEFLNDPEVRRSRVLIMEITYWDERKSIETTREWGHIHFLEFLPWLDRIESEKILIIHTSARYNRKALVRILDERLPEQHKGRVELFPRPD